jgi:hypothetical protein
MGRVTMMPNNNLDRSIAFDFVLAFLEPEIKSWRGEQPLGMVFWGYGAAISGCFDILFALGIYGDHITLEQALVPCIAAHTVWVLVSLWRSTSTMINTLWGVLARQIAVVWTGCTILVLTFIQLNLIETYLNVSSIPKVP